MEQKTIIKIVKRIKLAKRHKRVTNCFGTAFYIAGIFEKDMFICSPYIYEPAIAKLTKLEQPELYSLAIFKRGENRYIDHIAIITRINPLLITHRDLDEQFKKDEPLDEVVKRHSSESLVKTYGSITDIEYRRIPNFN